jgi:hypothetical protein
MVVFCPKLSEKEKMCHGETENPCVGGSIPSPATIFKKPSKSNDLSLNFEVRITKIRIKVRMSAQGSCHNTGLHRDLRQKKTGMFGCSARKHRQA